MAGVRIVTSVYSLARYSAQVHRVDAVVVGGEFTAAGGQKSYFIGLWDSTLPPEGVRGAQSESTSVWLAPNCPNPFNPQTKIAYSIQTPGDVRLTVHDVQGRCVTRLVSGFRALEPIHEINRFLEHGLIDYADSAGLTVNNSLLSVVLH